MTTNSSWTFLLDSIPSFCRAEQICKAGGFTSQIQDACFLLSVYEASGYDGLQVAYLFSAWSFIIVL